MSKMIERVAYALYLSSGFQRAFGTPEASWANDRYQVKETFRANAKAAIEAMRQPTDAMCRVGFEFLEDELGPSPTVVGAAYINMIDEALE